MGPNEKGPSQSPADIQAIVSPPCHMQETKGPIDQRKWLVTCEDQGAVNTAALSFTLYFLKLRQISIPDPFHRLWNDTLSAARKAGFMGAILLTSITHNLAYGPWQNQKWFNELKESAQDYFQTAQHPEQDTLFQSLLPHILRDRGVLDPSDERGSPEAAWELLRTADFLFTKGPKTATSRWFSWMEAMSYWSVHWHSRLLFLLYLGVQLGYIDNQYIQQKLVALSPAVAAAASTASSKDIGEGESTAQSKSDLARLRDGCKNSLHLAALIHGNTTHLFRARLLLYASESYRDFYSHWAHKLRTTEDGRAFLIGLATGEAILPSIHAVGNIYRDEVKLMQCGFIIQECTYDPRFGKQLPDDSPHIEVQDEKANELGLPP